MIHHDDDDDSHDDDDDDSHDDDDDDSHDDDDDDSTTTTMMIHTTTMTTTAHDDDDDDDDDDGSTNYFSDTALYRIPTRYGSTTIIELEHYLVPGVTGITFALVSCDSSRADYYDSVQVENGKLVLESNTVGHIHGSNTESETVCTVAGKGRAGTHRREFHFYTVSDRKPLALNGLSVTTVRVTEVDIQITTSAPGNYVRLGWRKTGSRPTFRIASVSSGTATVTIPGLEPETDYEIRAYSMTRQAFDLYRGGNSGSLISEITPPSKWIANLSGGGLGPSRSLTVTTTQLNRAPTAVGTIPSQTVPDGGTDSVDVSNYFSDPDSDTLTYSASSSDTSKATTRVSEARVSVTTAARAEGTVTITVTASDPGGLTATQSYSVTIGQPNRAPKAINSFQFNLDLHEGVNFIHIPLKVKSVDGQPASIVTLGDLYEVLKEVNYLLVLDSDTQSWVSYFGDRAADRVFRGYEGVIAFMNNARGLQFAGEVLDTSVNIHSGINFVGLPRRPSRSYSISDLFLSVPTIYAIIVEDNGQLKTITRADDDGDGPIIGGQSFILITTGAADVTFYGEDWGVPDGDSHDDDDDGAHKD